MARLPLLLSGRDNAPCPKANGTNIGTDNVFVLLCGSNVVGDTLDKPDADDFPACVDLCASHHPRCDAVSFFKKKCELRANLVPDKTHPSRLVDAAVGQYPGASSNCASLGGTQPAIGAGGFGTFCNFIINGKDISQNFAATFQDCMRQCAGTTECTAVSYDASLSQGFKNCYLKTGASAADNLAQQGIDTAVVQNAAAAADPAPASASPAPSPATTTVIQPTTVVPDPVTVSAAPAPVSSSPPATFSTPVVPASAPASTAGASFFTPSGASSPTVAPIPAISVATETVISIKTSVSVSNAVSVTQLSTISVTTEITATPSSRPSLIGTSAADSAITSSLPSSSQLDNSSSRAWIAAPVVGSIAALVVVAIVFVMLGRRRMRGRPGTAGTSMSAESGESGAGLFATWLPGSPRFRSRIMGASAVVGGGGGGRGRSEMGNFSSVTGKQPETQEVGAPGRTASMRSSVFGMLSPGGTRGGGGERLEDVIEGSDRFSQSERGAGGGGKGEGERDSVTPVYEVRNGKMELRESVNGFGQNRWSPPGERGITEYVYW